MINIKLDKFKEVKDIININGIKSNKFNEELL